MKRFPDIIPVLAYDPENRMFLTGDQHVAFVWASPPLVGGDDSSANMAKAALSIGLPAGAVIQFHAIAMPIIDAWIENYENCRVDALMRVDPSMSALLSRHVRNRAQFMKRGVKEPLLPRTGQLTHDEIILVCLKVPFDGIAPSEKDITKAIDVSEKFASAIGACGLILEEVDPEALGNIYRTLLYPKGEVPNFTPVDNLPLHEQVSLPGSSFRVQSEHIELNGGFAKVLGIKALPSVSNWSLGFFMKGEASGIGAQMLCPYMITLSLHHPKQGDKIADIKTKSMIANYQAFGPLLKFVPRLAKKKTALDILIHAIEDGEPIFDACLQVVLFGEDRDRVEETAASMCSYYTSLGMQMAPEKYILWPAFHNALPLGPSAESMKNLFRYSSMGASHVVALLPIVGEYKGNEQNAPAMLHVSRRGQIMGIDLYSSSTNYNAIVFAESGAGKSFFTQDLIINYLSKNAQVWVIDVGRSYYKLCKVLGGEFIDFSDHSGICINPFTTIEQIDDDAPLLQAIIEKMAAPTQGLDDYRLSRIEEGIKSVWGNLGNQGSISALADYFNRHSDPRVQDIGSQLFSFTHAGSMGVWFDGDANVDLSHDFVVLELEELKGRKTLQQVVLMQMVASIQRQMYFSKDPRPKILIIDEAWDLLDDPMVAKFIEHGYRRFRKYGGSAIIVTQSISDLYESPSGRAIAANSAFKFVLKQNSETVARLRSNGHFVAPEMVYNLMQTVHTSPGNYSEFLMMTDGGVGVARLIVDRFSQVLYSTAPKERKPIIDAIEAGTPPLEAIEEFIRING